MREPKFRWPAGQRPETVEDWAEVQEIERDIVLLYHQLASYSYIMGDLYYGTVYGLPYWQYLHPTGLDPDRQRFIREGCLVMILAMAWDQIDGSGAYINPHVAECKACIGDLPCEDADTQRLVRTVELALDLAEHGRESRGEDELIQLSSWVHKRYVRGYFQRIAQEFEQNPYFRDSR